MLKAIAISLQLWAGILILFQRNEYGIPLTEGHLGLTLAAFFCLFSPFIYLIGETREAQENDR